MDGARHEDDRNRMGRMDFVGRGENKNHVEMQG
jgi:hypothetical protein